MPWPKNQLETYQILRYIEYRINPVFLIQFSRTIFPEIIAVHVPGHVLNGPVLEAMGIIIVMKIGRNIVIVFQDHQEKYKTIAKYLVRMEVGTYRICFKRSKLLNLPNQ